MNDNSLDDGMHLKDRYKTIFPRERFMPINLFTAYFSTYFVTSHTPLTARNLGQIWLREGGASEAWPIHDAERDDAGAVKDGLSAVIFSWIANLELCPYCDRSFAFISVVSFLHESLLFVLY